MAATLSTSPAKKRQRLSSPPLFEDEYDDAALAVFDEIMSSQQLSQPIKPAPNFTKASLKRALDWDLPQQSSPPETTSFTSPAALSLHDDPDNVFADRKGFSTARSKLSFGFSSASALDQMHNDDDNEPSSSPETPQEVDVDAWFNASAIPPAGFMTAGFTSGKNKPLVVSEAALQSAKSRLSEWEKDVEDEASKAPGSASGFAPATKITADMEPPAAIPLSGSSKSNAVASPSFTGFSTPSLPKKQFSTPLIRNGAKPFTPPTMRPPAAPISLARTSSPLNPNRPSSSIGFTSAFSIQSPHPLSATPLTRANAQAPTLSSAKKTITPGFKTPFKVATPFTAPRTGPARFVTPFKTGMKPGEPGRSKLAFSTPTKPSPLQSGSNNSQALPSPTNWLFKPRVPIQRKQFFNLTPHEGRKKLAFSGLEPQRYDRDEFEEMGIDIDTLKQITPTTAMYFAFHTTSCNPTEIEHVALGPSEALEELLSRGCVLAKKPWVDNHWCLILWKLAGMVALDPKSEADLSTKRWCWDEVIRQLLYRYERELNSGYRPALRRVSTQDAPAEFPMTLCVSDVIWKDRATGETGHTERVVELELTDGWYRLRAEVDPPLMKAISRDVLKVGRKIGVAGARLLTEKKDPLEILEAYNSVKLGLNGNSSHLMPWHTTLGFMAGPCISTLYHLSAEGGVVAAMDFVVLKVYPIAYMEFVETEDGSQVRQGPRDQAEEDKMNGTWRHRREVAACSLRSKYEKKYTRYQGIAERLERKAGDRFKPGDDDYLPDNLDSLYDDLEYADSTSRLMASMTPMKAGWLAKHIRKQLEKEQDRIGEEIESELDVTYPPRKVRSFCVLVVQDAKTMRKTSHRSAQLTVWDANTLSIEEGDKPGSFKEGQRFMVTHLTPTQCSAWMDRSPGSVVYLSTRRETRWNKLKMDA